ncbi:multiheme c-type cytochrome (seleno)protein ExtKL [uncultured Desulfobulbus sp.]|uniref:multiheme c-type cytochrome (seleno)protein ExtKL n=1 Tax=uncultured Desulfobulbus sp. TaxID=239745 RepID=UPI0029C8E827|nr:multiheme c-type cytochrome ExtKL [uncultured Desulfobulbus sp.]
MKLIRVVVAALLLAIIPSVSPGKEAQTLDELVQQYDALSCKGCHPEIFAQWEQSLHAKPMLGPIGRTLATFQGYVNSRDTELKKSREVAPGTREFLKPCVECHLPQMMDASEGVANEIAKAIVDGNEEVLGKLQITCIVCHNRNAIIRKFRDGKPQPNVIYGPKFAGPHGDKKFTTAAKSELLADTVFCAQCHQGPNVQHYDEPMWCTSTFDSHQQFYVPMGGTESCQQCHMKKEGGHRFPPNYQDPAQTSKRLQEWIDLNITAIGYRMKPNAKELIPMVVINSEVVSRIGHRFPDGCPSPNRVTLDIKVTTKDGKEIFQDTKIYMPQHKLGYDENTMVYAANRKLTLMRDTSLQPFVPKKETIEVKLPDGVQEAVVEAVLTFRQLPGVPEAEFPIHKVTKEVSLKR